MGHLTTLSAFGFINLFGAYYVSVSWVSFTIMPPTKFALYRMKASLSKSNQNIGGSSVPAVTPVNPALTSSLITIVVAQVSQKDVFHCVPLSLVNAYYLPFLTVILTFSSLKYISVPNADPFEVDNIDNGIRH
jgi:hypothetical protein